MRGGWCAAFVGLLRPSDGTRTGTSHGGSGSSGSDGPDSRSSWTDLVALSEANGADRVGIAVGGGGVCGLSRRRLGAVNR